MDGISVIICCYNSADRLPQTLAHLASQKFSQKISWEIIVVDNASTDHTTAVARNCWEEQGSPVPLKVVTEPQMGLTNARNRGVTEAKYEILIFCDDDNWLSDNYVGLAFSLMRNDLSVGAIGGFGSPVFEREAPAWFKHWMSFYAIGDQNESIAHEVNGYKYVYGAGMVVSKVALKTLAALNFKNITTDRVGKKLVSGGDIELCFALQIIGYTVLYNPQLEFSHFITSQKLKLRYALRLASGIGYSSDLLFPYRKLFNVDLKFPFPSQESFREQKKYFLRSIIILLIPLKRYGSFFEKLRVTSYLSGKMVFHRDNQCYFTDNDKILLLK
jgi:glycosyltransferase involved in cell wall biosynthesis